MPGLYQHLVMGPESSSLCLPGWSLQQNARNTGPTLISHFFADPMLRGSKTATSCKHQWPAHGGARLHWFVPVPLPVTHFWLKAPAAPLRKRMTSHFLPLLNPSDIQPGYRWEGQRIVHATGNSPHASISCAHMQNLPLLSRFEVQNKPTKIYNPLFTVSQQKICPLLPAKKYRDTHTDASTQFWWEIFLNRCRSWSIVQTPENVSQFV